MTFDLERASERSDAFDPIVEGGRHHLSADVSLAIWARVRLESTDGAERVDEPRARKRFHAVAARVAALGGRLRLGPGRLTLDDVEVGSANPYSEVFVEPVPGKRTLQQVEARRWEQRTRGADATMGPSEWPSPVAALDELPNEVTLDPSVGSRLSCLFGVDLTRVKVVPDSPLAAGSIKALMKDGEVHFRRGAHQPGTSIPGGAAGAGGGAAATSQKEPPNAATAPELALGQLRGARPDQIALLFGRIHRTAHADIAKARAVQQANPPMQMSTGAIAAPRTASPKDGETGNAAAATIAHPPKAASDPNATMVLADQSVRAAQPSSRAHYLLGRRG